MKKNYQKVGTNGVKETAGLTAPVASNTLGVNVFTSPGKPIVGERPKPFGEAFGFDPIRTTSLHVPSIGLIVAGDTTPESRKNWIAALNPAIVVAGHKKLGAADSPSTIQDTRRYLQDFDRLQKTRRLTMSCSIR